MNEAQGYLLGQSALAARRLEIQDAHSAVMSERLLDGLSLRPGDRVVELGCGPGSFSRRIMNRLGEEGVLVGVDSSAGLLKQAQKALRSSKNARFEPVLADVAQLGPWLERADVIVGRTVLHHVPKAERMLGRLRASLPAGVRIGFLEPDFKAPLGRLGYLEATTRPEVTPLCTIVQVLHQLYQARGIVPDIGANMARVMETAGYRQIRSAWAEIPTDAMTIENILMIYDEIRDHLKQFGIMTPAEVEQQKELLRALPGGNLPHVWGIYCTWSET